MARAPGAGEVVAVDMEGRAEVMAAGPAQMGRAIDCLTTGVRSALRTTAPSVKHP